VVLDTNSLLHYEPPESISWAKIAWHSPVRLVIPLRVLEEVDAKKYSTNRRLRDRARSVLIV
jgi:predicted ribonuclease YlaK